MLAPMRPQLRRRADGFPAGSRPALPPKRRGAPNIPPPPSARTSPRDGYCWNSCRTGFGLRGDYSSGSLLWDRRPCKYARRSFTAGIRAIAWLLAWCPRLNYIVAACGRSALPAPRNCVAAAQRTATQGGMSSGDGGFQLWVFLSRRSALPAPRNLLRKLRSRCAATSFAE